MTVGYEYICIKFDPHGFSLNFLMSFANGSSDYIVPDDRMINEQ
jgi:hypothetical protein